jgi:hypothetical protein
VKTKSISDAHIHSGHVKPSQLSALQHLCITHLQDQEEDCSRIQLRCSLRRHHTEKGLSSWANTATASPRKLVTSHRLRPQAPRAEETTGTQGNHTVYIGLCVHVQDFDTPVSLGVVLQMCGFMLSCLFCYKCMVLPCCGCIQHFTGSYHKICPVPDTRRVICPVSEISCHVYPSNGTRCGICLVTDTSCQVCPVSHTSCEVCPATVTSCDIYPVTDTMCQVCPVTDTRWQVCPVTDTRWEVCPVANTKCEIYPVTEKLSHLPRYGHKLPLTDTSCQICPITNTVSHLSLSCYP